MSLATNGNGAGIVKGVLTWIIGSIVVAAITSISSLTISHDRSITTLQAEEKNRAAEVAGLKAQLDRVETKIDRISERRN